MCLVSFSIQKAMYLFSCNFCDITLLLSLSQDQLLWVGRLQISLGWVGGYRSSFVVSSFGLWVTNGRGVVGFLWVWIFCGFNDFHDGLCVWIWFFVGIFDDDGGGVCAVVVGLTVVVVVFFVVGGYGLWF